MWSMLQQLRSSSSFLLKIFIFLFILTSRDFPMENKRVKRVVIASTSGVVGCRPMNPLFTKLKSYFKKEEDEVPNDDSPYCTEVVKEWPYYLSKIISEQKTLVFFCYFNF